jgi:hypothetical protein
MVTRFYEGIFTGSAEEQVPTILSEAARVFEADIATWFLVTEDRTQLRLVDVYNDLGDPETRPPARPYDLNWDAQSEEDVHGLTAWTAVSGEPLHVPSIHSLTKVHGKSHAGRWDEWLYPKGIQDPASGFLCMYAVPLFQPTGGPPRERVVGVLKMERRRMKKDRRRNRFTRSDLESFNVIARIMGFAYFHSERQMSLTLADIGHNLIRPIGDAAFSLETVLGNTEPAIGEHSRLQIKTACNMLRALSRMLAVAKESYNKPLERENVDVVQDVAAQTGPISASTGRKIDIRQTGPMDQVVLTKRSHAALINVVINLLQNATQNSPRSSEVIVNVTRKGTGLSLSIENQGSPIPTDTIERARSSADPNQRFRGLPRSFQLASRNGWDLDYSIRDRVNRFTLRLPLHP